MSTEDWCDFNDMPASQCAHCRKVPELPTMGGSAGPKPVLGTITVAQYHGTCASCENPIEPGDHIGPDVNSNNGRAWVHYGCGQ